MSFTRSVVPTGLLILASAGSYACDIAVAFPPHGSNFLHVKAAKGKLTIQLPANARGVLYQARIELLPIASDHDRNAIYSTRPRALRESDFVVRDLTENRRVRARLSYLDVTTKLGLKRPVSFLADELSGFRPGNGGFAFTADLMAKAKQHQLPDISASIQREQGLFRIGPAVGFVMGHSYSIRPLRDRTKYPVQVTIISPMPIHKDEQFVLLADGPPSAMQLPGWGCNGQQASLVQPLRYVIPPARAPFVNLAMAYTMHRFEGADADPTFRPAGQYVQQPSISQEYDPLTATTTAKCRISRAPLPQRLVKGYIGMLEVEDSLHETAPLEVVFGDAVRDACFPLKNDNDKHAPPLNLQPLPKAAM